MESTHLIWHWKLFDLAAPLHFLENIGIHPERISGLLCMQPFGSPDEYGISFLGIDRMSEGRLRFYQHCLDLLLHQYDEKGLELRSSTRSASDYLRSLGDSSETYVVWYSDQPGSEETSFIAGLSSALPDNVTLQPLPANTLLQLDELPFDLASMPETFTKFRKKVEKRGYYSFTFSSQDADYRTAYSPGRRQLQDYLFNEKGILTYKETRNGLGPGGYSSRLSKWLAVGAISGAEVGNAILQFEQTVEKNESTYWLLFELLWRDFFHFLNRKVGVRTFAPSGFLGRRSPGLQDSLPWQFCSSNKHMRFDKRDRGLLTTYWQRFRNWAKGQTGEDFVDTMMREIYFTGELSNRGRQCAASYLIHDLHLPWWWGAQWFEHLLLDFDVSSNWGNWAYIAGVGADPRPVRKFNMVVQAERYDSDGSYRKWGKAQGWRVPEESLPIEFPGEFY
jgi:deoxyribodipyrimidine photo-lyase